MALTLPEDVDGFVRRECPGCRREFKTRPSPLDGAAMLWVVMGELAHANGGEIPDLPPVRACPYCAHQAPGAAWIWSAFRKELERVATLLGERVRYEQLMHVPRTLALNPKPTFVPVPPPPLPPRLRPDPLGHFVRVELDCCGEVLKVRANHGQRLICPACGARQGEAWAGAEPNLPIPNALQ